MSLPEITTLCRVLARSNADDASEQARNLDRLRELQEYVGPHAGPGMTACLEGAVKLLAALATSKPLDSGQLLGLASQLLCTVEKNWSGPDPDARLLSDLYREETPPSANDEQERRDIQSTVHSAKTATFQVDDIEEAQRRVEEVKRTPRINDMVLGELLVELGHASDADVESALREQAETGEMLGRVLIARGVVSEHLVEETVQLQVRLRSESTLESIDAPVEKEPEPKPDLTLAIDEAARQRERGADNTLGAILLRQGAVSEKELERALAMQRASGLRLGETLVDMHATGWETINRAIDLQKRLRNAAGLPASTRRLKL